MLKNNQKQNKDIPNKQIKKNIAFFSDNIEEKAQYGVDFIQDSQQQLTNVRYLSDLDDPLPTNIVNSSNYQKGNIKIKNRQNLTNDVQQSQRKYSQNLIQQKENIKNNLQDQKFKNSSKRQSLSPQQQLDKDNRNIYEIDQKQLYEELDEWKNELENTKRVQNYTEQIFGIKESTQSFLGQDRFNNRHLRQFKQISVQNLNGNQAKNEYEKNQNGNINQQTSRQTMSISNDIQLSQIDSTKFNASNIQQRMKLNVQESTINQEPQINEIILNSIVNNYDFSSSGNQQIQKNNSNSTDDKQKHLLSNGASPQMKRKIKKKYYEPENEISSNQLATQQQTSSLQNYDSETQDSRSVIKIIAQPKKTIKQIQSETNEMLIEKLFLLKLKKKIEPLHQEHIEDLKHRFLAKFKEQSSLQDNINGQKQKQFLSRLPSPRVNEERQNSGFISERNTRPQSITSQFFQKQQEIVKDEIENFQKKTLDSFKFIQQIKRAKSGTPQLLNLVSGKKVGGNQSQTKTEQYIQQLEKEFTLNQVKQSAQLTKNLENANEGTFLNEQVQQQLLLNYKQMVSNIKEKKDILESSRLETFKLQSIINQIQEEKKDLQQKMQVELEKAALQKYQVFSRQNITLEKEQESNQEKQLRQGRNKEQKNQKSFANLNSQIQEQQKNIQIDFDRRQRSLSNKIRQLQQLLKENQLNSNSLQEELSNLKNSKLTKKKQLKNYYLSLLQQHKSYESPQISIIKLIEYMQEIDEEIDEKMLPNYFDQDNIEFVKKLQRLSIQLEKLQEEFQIVSKSTKNSLHSQIQLNKIQQSQQEFVSSPILKSSLNLTQPKKPFLDQQSQIEIKMNNQIIKNLAQGSSPALSQSLISQNLVSNRNWEDEDKKLLKMMIGKEVNHKQEIKKKLSKISKNTLQTKNQNLEYFQLYSQNYIVQEEDDQEKDNSSLLFQDRVKENALKEREPRYSSALKFANRQKEEDEYYFFLYNLKRGSLSILEYNKKLSEQIQHIQTNIDSLKEQELERLIKKYNNITAEDRLLNVKKIFILMYGFQEGNDWYSKFIKKRKEMLIKSVASKTFNFQEYIYSKNNQQKIDFMINQKDQLSKQEKYQIQQDFQKNENESKKETEKVKSYNPQQIHQQKELILNRFKVLQETPNSIGGSNTTRHQQLQDPFQLFIKKTNLEQISNLKANPRETKNQKQRKSVHFQNYNLVQEQNEINQLSNTTLNFSSKNL
ncbi:hypothetical protein TTHERM_00295320 (macronuclear) [Tetrahymena thermophila SB210]|uniref:Uncharacterized protein n=1 Tax=Tetrahymena thermophila (strain SB210) TaxID=312017 RepID=I7LUE9_TETTS|nr:hypothetical protein TTHERM_00295320 [Tetrahymena thermophila SB210]EAR92919.1 hypothetical protein TTHERM_00295320 [Tetrahymena thermophila SB210]|eukprot:XP_001013164.1 hypothetical protein TTHERM_00295320 [Tetrahymena thermophila SB210]